MRRSTAQMYDRAGFSKGLFAVALVQQTRAMPGDIRRGLPALVSSVQRMRQRTSGRAFQPSIRMVSCWTTLNSLKNIRATTRITV